MTEYSIKNLYNKPTICIDGKPIAPVVYALSDIHGSNANTKQAQENIENFAKAGINLVACDANLCSGWRRVTEFDPEPVSSEILSVLDANPNAKILQANANSFGDAVGLEQIHRLLDSFVG